MIKDGTPREVTGDRFVFLGKSRPLKCIIILLSVIIFVLLIAVIVIGVQKYSSSEKQKINYSNDVDSPPSKIYELRMYRIHVKDYKPTMQAFKNISELRSSFSKVFGFWTGEIGTSINQLVHIAEYDSLSQRRTVRTNLGRNDTWNTEFVSKFLPAVHDWTNALMTTVPHTQINTNFVNDPDRKAVYKLEILKGFAAAPPASGDDTKEILVGRFLSVLGPTNTEYRLWRYANIDDLFEFSWKKSLANPQDGTSMLLYPTEFSRLA
ncbi:protein NipSnap homolog 3B-like isoform X2 [Physella acuta]|uniref:protein NipSnap homolog 3B-like isoform X2 n=1 Tax=Physella acuta TaxID=109671 RepID=UPI0027DE1A16|nr:protein NipSnap homolog 3B-like isoform X2 [Physella acuta]